MQRDSRATLRAAFLLVMAANATLGQESQGLKRRLDVIVKAQDEARRRYHEGLAGKSEVGEQKPAVDLYLEQVARNTDEVLELVRSNPADAAVVEALTFVIRTARAGPGDQSHRAMEILRDHVRDPGMGQLCANIWYFAYAPPAEALLREVLEKNPSRKERGAACYSLAQYDQYQARTVRRVRENPKEIGRFANERYRAQAERLIEQADPAALDRESESLLERIIAEFADVQAGSDKRSLGEVAEGELFAIRNLSVGKVAPEIRGKDHEGEPFSLGDYRGKVVVLTFSGNWCGPCVGMYPGERALVARMKGKPFAAVSVNTDADLATLKKAIASGEITWRCWWDGGTEGPITTRWGISSFPSVFVIDREGILRFRDVRGDELDRAVESLVDEARPKARPGA